MSTQGNDSDQRAYSPDEVVDRLHFIKLPQPVVSVPSMVEWWPCLVFADMMELNSIDRQFHLFLRNNQTMMTYITKLPESATCRVALLFGEQAPPGNAVLQFDLVNAPPFIIEPFPDKLFELNALYAQNEEFTKAVQQSIPIMRLCDIPEMHSSDNLPPASKSKEHCLESPRVNVSLNDPKNVSKASAVQSDKIPPSEPPSAKAKPTSMIKNGGFVLYETESSGTLALASTSKENCLKLPSVKVSLNDPKSATKESAVQPDKSTEMVNRSGQRIPQSEPPSAKAKLTPVKYGVEFVDIPTYKDVKNALIKGGYTLQPKKICRPPIAKSNNGASIVPNKCFMTVKALRNDLCTYGVNCRCGTLMDEEKACQCWTEDEKWEIKLWVRYNVIRGPIKVSSPVQQISSIHQAAKYLIRIGYNRQQLKSPLSTEEQRNDLFRYLSQHGLPNEGDENAPRCDYTAISPEERFSLEYFISTNHYRVKTFSYTPPPALESAPPPLTMDLESPGPASELRPKRSAALRRLNDDAVSVKKPKVTHDEGGATIVSVESNVSVVSKSKTPGKKVLKNVNNRIVSERPSRRLTDSSESHTSHPIEMDHSPILRSSISSTKENTPRPNRLTQQRVSLSPMIHPVKFDEVSIPVFEGNDYDKLVSCLDALKLSTCSNLPTICPSYEASAITSKFAANMSKVSYFVQAVHMSRGRNGTGNMGESSAAFYVCGAPGLGKTSGVHWCCNQVAKSTKENDVALKICHVNASYLTAQANPLRLVMKEMATCLGIKSPNPSESTLTKFLSNRKNSAVLLVVVDEIDAFVTGSGRATTGTECLETLLRWANNPSLQMGLIGISNCMNDNKISDIRDLGEFLETVMFSPYSEYELQQILLARVGSTVVAPNVIDYIAKKVATSTGDARKALEMAANAVQHKIDQSHGSMTDSTDGHLVKMPHVIQANKEEIVNLKERISGLPSFGKVILCVLTTYAQAGAVDTTIGKLKQCVSECMRLTGMEDEMVQMDDFLVLLETLVDSGLLRASSSTTQGSKGSFSQQTLSDVHRQPIRLGTQLDDIEKVLESELKQSFYLNLRENARSRRQDE